MTALRAKDYTPGGTKIEGTWENDRNAESADLFKAIIREVYGARDVIVAHHLVHVRTELRDGFSYEIVEEIPSADTLIFDHEVAQKLWGEGWKAALCHLAVTSPDDRDQVLAEMLAARGVHNGAD